MKPLRHALMFMLPLALAASALDSRAALLAGWDNWGTYSTTGTIYSPDQFMSGIAATLSVGSDRRSVNFNSNDGTFGGEAGASTTGNALVLSNANAAVNITLTLTNNSGADISLTSIHFDFAPRENAMGDDGPRSFSLAYTSGDLGVGGLVIGSQSNIPIWITSSAANNVSNYPDYDLALSPTLADTTLANGQQAVFTLTLGNWGDTFVGSVIDNVAFVGSPIPEPSTYAILAGGLGMLISLRRRKRQN